MLATMTTIVIGPDDKISGSAGVTLPPGMTQEEADRLVREADERSKEKQ